MTSPSKNAACLGHLLASRDPGALAIALAYLDPVIRREQGNASRIAKSIGVPPRTFLRWLAAHPDLSSAVDAARCAKDAAL